MFLRRRVTADYHKHQVQISIGFTGHRDIIGEENILIEFEKFISELRKYAPDVPIRVLTGLASGADQLITKKCFEYLERKEAIYPVAILPMPKAQYLKTLGGKDEEKKFTDVLQEMDEKGCPIIELPYLEEKDQNDEENEKACYVNLGQYLINKSDLLLAVWDGIFLDKSGGTGHIVKSAFDPLEGMYKEDGYNKEMSDKFILNNYFHNKKRISVYHIPAKRELNPDGFFLDKDPGFVQVGKDGQLKNSFKMPEKEKVFFLNINVLYKEINNSKLDEVNSYYPCDHYTKYTESNDDANLIARNFAKFDSLANFLQRKTERIHLITATLTLLLTATFLVYAKLYKSPVVLLGYLIVFLMGYSWYRVRKPNSIKKKYSLARSIAETLRVEFFWFSKGMIDQAGNHSIANKIPATGVDDIRIVESVLKQATLLGQSNSHSLYENPSKHILSDWVKEQQLYYQKTAHKLHKKLEIGERIINVAIVGPIALSIILLICYSFIPEVLELSYVNISLKDVLVFLIGFIPVLGAVVELHLTNCSYKELWHQYSTTNNYLENFISKVQNFSCKDPVENAAYETLGIELSREHYTWLKTTNQKVVGPAHGG